MADINAIADQIQGLTLLEASQLVKLLEEKLGVSAAAAAPMMAAGAAAPAAAAAVEEKTEFTVVLTAVGANKINVIKAVREVTSLGLEGSQGLGRRRSQAGQGRHQQGRSRGHQEEVHRRRRHRGSKVTPGSPGWSGARIPACPLAGLPRPAVCALPYLWFDVGRKSC